MGEVMDLGSDFNAILPMGSIKRYKSRRRKKVSNYKKSEDERGLLELQWV
jgi:hypothetical protein